MLALDKPGAHHGTLSPMNRQLHAIVTITTTTTTTIVVRVPAHG